MISKKPLPQKRTFDGIVLAAFIAMMMLFGGASRTDALTQPVIFAFAAVAIGYFVVLRPHGLGRLRPIGLLLAALVGTMVLQLIPLPPAIWNLFPAGSLISRIDAAAGLGEVWRPLSIMPDATLTALFSCAVPIATLLLCVRSAAKSYRLPIAALLAVGILGLAIGLMQVTAGAPYFFRFTNEGALVGLFANRNHCAVFLAVLPALAAPLFFEARDKLQRREFLYAGGFGALLIVAFCVVMTGSRIGLVVLLFELAGIAALAWMTQARSAGRVRKDPHRKIKIAAIASSLVIVLFFIVAMSMDKGSAIQRFLATDIRHEGRVEVLGSLLSLLQHALPSGFGFGTFDRAYRVYEPFESLDLSYLNHAHNDLIEICVEAGFLGVALVGALLAIVIVDSLRVWRAGRRPFSYSMALARSGSLVAGGLLIASLSDYPLRTPALATLLTLALVWLRTWNDQPTTARPAVG